MKKSACILLAAVMVLSMLFSGCAAGKTAEDGKIIVGISMPSLSIERWKYDGANMKEMLEERGYEVILQYAEDNIQTQINQIENMIVQGASCLVITAVDSLGLTVVEKEAADLGIPIIAYDRLLMMTDSVSYYASFDNERVGRMIGEYIVEKMELEKARESGESYTIEIFSGSPDDNNAIYFYNGYMSAIQEYLDDGTLECRTGRTSFAETSTPGWSQESAMENCENYLAAYYPDHDLDIALAAADSLSYGVKAALDSAGYSAENWPLLTGQNGEVMSVKNIIEGKQTMTIMKDVRILAEKTVDMVDAVLLGEEPEINDTTSYDNGKKVVPSYLCDPIVIDIENYREEAIDSGFLDASYFD